MGKLCEKVWLFLDLGCIVLVMDREFVFEDVVVVYLCMEGGDYIGKIVLKV